MLEGYKKFNQEFQSDNVCSEPASTSKKERSSLIISVHEAMQKNKRMAEQKKMQKLRAIKARKLRIKINEMFHNYFLTNKISKQRSLTILKSSSSVQSLPKKLSSLMKRNYMLLKNRTENKEQSKQIKEELSLKYEIERRQKIAQQFDNLNWEQLEEIQENQLYYLSRDQLIQLFRKYMLRKRSNYKEASRASLMRQSYSKSKAQLVNIDSLNTQEAKKYIIQTIGIQHSNKSRKLSLHLLTNPLQQFKPKSITNHKNLQKSFKILQELKEKQKINLQKIRIKDQQAKLNYRIDRDYINGIVMENRAIMLDQKKKLSTQRNSLHDLKSKQFKDRLTFLNQTYGRSVQMAEEMRASFLRQKTKAGNFSLQK